MSLFIRAVIVVLLALLAIGISFLLLVCWALAACASRRKHYLEKDYLSKQKSYAKAAVIIQRLCQFIINVLKSIPKSIICLLIESSVNIICLNNVYKGFRINFMHLFHQKLGFFCGYNRIDHTGLFIRIASCTLEAGCCMIGKFKYFLVNLIRFLRNNKQGMLLISLMQHLYHLSRSKLEDDRVKCSIPSEE